MIIPKSSGNINLCNFKRLPKFERCGLSLLTAAPTIPGSTPHPVVGVLAIWIILDPPMEEECIVLMETNAHSTCQVRSGNIITMDGKLQDLMRLMFTA